MTRRTLREIAAHLENRYETMMQKYETSKSNSIYQKANKLKAKHYYLTRWFDMDAVDNEGFLQKSAINMDMGLSDAMEDLLDCYLFDDEMNVADDMHANVIRVFAKRDLLSEKIFNIYGSDSDFNFLMQFSDIPLKLMLRSMTAEEYGQYISGQKPIVVDPLKNISYYI